MAKPGTQYALPRDALLVRGGRSALPDLHNAAGKALAKFGRFGVSAFGGEGVDVEGLLRSTQVLARYACFRQTTVGAVLDAGFEVEKTGGARHFTIWLPDDQSETLQRLVAAFGPVEPNPLRVAEG